jgi:hypothetical protein
MAGIAARDTLAVYRDDGPLARAIGRRAGAGVRLPAPLLLVAAALPLAAVLALAGDDSPAALGIGVACLLLLGGLSSARPPAGRFAWTAPPLLRAVEYGGLLCFAALYGDAAVPACFALLAAVAFRHYDTVYRVRHQGGPPASWARDLGGGWDGRLLAGYLLLATGALTAGLYAAAALLALASVGESVASWLRTGRAERPAMYADEEDEDE